MAPALKFLVASSAHSSRADCLSVPPRRMALRVALRVALHRRVPSQGTRGSACTSFITLPVYTSPTPPPTRDAP